MPAGTYLSTLPLALPLRYLGPAFGVVSRSGALVDTNATFHTKIEKLTSFRPLGIRDHSLYVTRYDVAALRESFFIGIVPDCLVRATVKGGSIALI